MPGIGPAALGSAWTAARLGLLAVGLTQRVPIVVLAFVGLFILGHMAAYQLGHIEGGVDPFFGDCTETSSPPNFRSAGRCPTPARRAGPTCSNPVRLYGRPPGAGGPRRGWWRVRRAGRAAGAGADFFIVIQRIFIGTYCAPRPVAAAAMVIMIPFSLDDLGASRVPGRARRAGRPLWQVFGQGDTMPGGKRRAAFEFDLPPVQFASACSPAASTRRGRSTPG